jgi:hypothetical protein
MRRKNCHGEGGSWVGAGLPIFRLCFEDTGEPAPTVVQSAGLLIKIRCVPKITRSRHDLHQYAVDYI